MKKLIPHVYMSKDDFPLSLSPHDVLEKMFEFFQSWKSRLYDMISYNSLPPSGVDVEVKPPNIAIKQAFNTSPRRAQMRNKSESTQGFIPCASNACDVRQCVGVVPA